MATTTTDTYTAVIDPRFCVPNPSHLALWFSQCSCLIPNAHLISATSESDEESDGILFTLDYDQSCWAFGLPDLVLRDEVAGLDLVHIFPEVFSFRSRCNVYRGESLLMSIRTDDLALWRLKLHIFVAPVGAIGIKDHRQLNEDSRVPDFTLKPAPGFSNMLYTSVVHIFNSRGEKIAEATKSLDGWICGGGPDYRISICARVDRAFIVLLLGLYHVIIQNRKSSNS